MGEGAAVSVSRMGPIARSIDAFNLFVYHRLRRAILKSLPLAQSRVRRVQERRPGDSWLRWERTLTRRFIGRATFLAVLSSVPALILVWDAQFWALATAGVLIATLWESVLGIKEQVRYTLGLFYLRGYRGDDEGLVELALFHVFGASRFDRAAKAAKETLAPLARETGNELAESFLEIVAMQLSKRLALRVSWRAAIRVAPLAGAAVGAAISFAQARRSSKCILESLSDIAHYQPPHHPHRAVGGGSMASQA